LAWVGGLALFLGLAFFVKYSFERDLITPEMRVAISYILGAGMLAGGFVMAGRKYAVLGQSLCATGVLTLYAATFAAHSLYHFIGFIPAYLVMLLVTAAAFLLAVRLQAQVVAVLGLLGGFLTPILLSTGKDNPLGLFSYVALLDVGLMAIVRQRRWNYLVLLAALGTLGMELGWVNRFFTVDKAHIALGIFLSMEALFLAAFALSQKRQEVDEWISGAALIATVAPLLFASYLLKYPTLGGRPGLIFTFVLFADLGLFALAWLRGKLAFTYFIGGSLSFLVLFQWTVTYLNPPLLNWALGGYFVFALLHGFFPVGLERRYPGTLPMWYGFLFPVLGFLLVMLPIYTLTELSLTIWLFVLLLDGLIFGLALITGSILAILGALFLTVVSTGLWIIRLPVALLGIPELLLVIGGFALLFFLVGIFAGQWIKTTAESEFLLQGKQVSSPRLVKLITQVRPQLPSFAIILPFLLLIMVVLRLPLPNPSPVFSLAMLLIVLLLGVVRLTPMDWLGPIGLACALMLENVWQLDQMQDEFALVPLLWHLAFYMVFALFPFLFHRSLSGRKLPWVVGALSGPLHFNLIYGIASTAYRNPYLGLVPAALALPSLAGLYWLVRHLPVDADKRNSLLAWWGGAALFFITLIFPIQFDKQWITLGWALEGMALLWLFHRVPHPGLKVVGVALLTLAFIRLALNPAVLAYHHRAATPILNWYLYTYGITIACLISGARLLRPPHNRVFNVNVPPWLYGFSAGLAFLLLNIEIADYFSTSRSLTFQFYGNFARDMTYTIAWALFAFMLLSIGIGKQIPGPRYASLGLLSITLLKLFLHDLARLDALYRIGAFLGVAVVLLLASFIYQRFLARESKET
jgi:hypothetical protein